MVSDLSQFVRFFLNKFLKNLLVTLILIGYTVLEWWEGRSSTGGLGLKTLQALQYHYFFSWMDVLVGYAALVTQTWLCYHQRMRMSHVCKIIFKKYIIIHSYQLLCKAK